MQGVKKGIVIVVSLFLFLAFPISVEFQSNSSVGLNGVRGKTITVDINGSADYESIQDAVDNADEGDTVLIKKGTYDEKIRIEKTITLIGEEGASIDGSIKIYGESVCIKNLVFIDQDSSYSSRGVVIYSNNNKIESNIFYGRSVGIEVNDATNNDIIGNTFNDCNTGLSLEHSIENNVIKNSFSNCWMTIYKSNSTSMTNNTFYGKCINFNGDSLNHFTSHSIDESNLFEGKPIIYLTGERDRTIEGEETYICLADCENITIKDSSGHVNLWFCSDSKITNCDFYTHTGVIMKACEGLEISHNTFTSSQLHNWFFLEGLVIEDYLLNSTIYGNSMSGSTLSGFLFDFLINVTIENNYFELMNYVYLALTESKVINNTFNKSIFHSFSFIKDNTFQGNCFYEMGPNFDWYYLVEEKRYDYFEIDPSNTVNDKPIYCFLRRENETVPPGAGQVLLIESKNITVSEQEITRTNIGIFMINSSGCIIERNNCSNNEVGMDCFLECSNNIFRDNICSNNLRGGMDLSSKGQSDNNIVINNICNNNQVGIGFWGSGNRIESNICKNNGANGIALAGGFTDDVITCINNSIANNSCNNNGDNGIYFDSFNHRDIEVQIESTLVENNICISNNNGINLDGNNNTILENNCSLNRENGIYCDWIINNDLIGNTCNSNGADGIEIEGKLNNLIKNTCDYNRWNGISCGNGNAFINENSCNWNNDSGISGRFWLCLIQYNNCTYNSRGIYSWNTEQSVISNNTLANNEYGFYFRDSISHNMICYNVLKNNSYYGLIFTDIDFIQDLSAGDYDPDNYICSIHLNVLFENSFINNNNGTDQAYDDSPDNYWDSTGLDKEYIENWFEWKWVGGEKGNYWSDWNSPDHDADGIVDIPYNISGDGDAVDFYPLVIPSGKDTDGDFINDVVEGIYGTDIHDPESHPSDLDRDGIPDDVDGDRDGDGYPNDEDDYPDDPDEWERTDWILIAVLIFIVVLIISSIIIIHLTIYKKKAAEEQDVEDKDKKPSRSSVGKQKKKNKDIKKKKR